MVNHGHFTVNGKKANIPSMFLVAGDVLEVKESSRASVKFKDMAERTLPKWLSFDYNNIKGSVVQTPERQDVDLEVKEHLIVELYSK